MDALSLPASKFVDGHRRTSSNNSESYAAFKAQRGHRRTMSNNTVDLHRVLATSPTTETNLRPAKVPQKVPDPPDRLTPDSLGGSEEEQKVPKKGSGFLGMLEAAITYFAEDRPIRALAASNGQAELLNLRTSITGLKQRMLELETDNEAIKKANLKLVTQHESYARHIGTLNAQLLDLQLLSETENRGEQPTVFQPNDSEDSLEESEPTRPTTEHPDEEIKTSVIRRTIDSPQQTTVQGTSPDRRTSSGPKVPRVANPRSKVKVNSAIYFS